MSETRAGVLAMIGACAIWGLSPVYYRLLAHLPPLEVLGHRGLWSLVFFAGLLAVQGRLGELRATFANRRHALLVALAMANVSVNWFLFIWATMVGQNTETSLGYFISPLIAVLFGRLFFRERLSGLQLVAVALAALAVTMLTLGLGTPPWIALILAVTFAFYGVIKKMLPLGPMVSVTAEVVVFLPFALGILVWFHATGQGSFGPSLRDNLLLMISGPMTALPLILFSAATRRIQLSTVGLLQYINPSLQLGLAALVFGEALTRWHALAFPTIWVALALYTLVLWRQDPADRRVAIAEAGVSAQVTKASSEGSAKP